MKKVIFIFTLLLICSAIQVHAFTAAIKAVISSSYSSSCTTTTITQSTNNDTSDLTVVILGQGFTSSGTKITGITVTFSGVSGSPTAKMRIGSSANLTTYLAESTSTTLSNGTYKFAFDLAVTNATQYYFGVQLASGTGLLIARSTSDVYAGTNNKAWYQVGADWNLSFNSDSSSDITFIIEGCQ